MSMAINDIATQKHSIKKENERRLGTLYSLVTNVDSHNIYLYKNLSESPKQAAERFLMMHQCYFAAGGYAGRFMRANTGLYFVPNNPVEVEFQYILDQKGCLSASQYSKHQHVWEPLFAGWWYDFVNQQAVTSERLYRFASIKSELLQVGTLQELEGKTHTLKSLLRYEDSPERFQEYLAFIEGLRNAATTTAMTF